MEKQAEQPVELKNKQSDNHARTPSPALQQGDIIELLITGINHEGQGIGRCGNMIVFVPAVIPGDQIWVQIQKQHSRYAIGRLIKMLSPSADRILASCPQADDCGGCTLQTMAYAAQLRHKQQLVGEALERIGKVPDLAAKLRPILAMDDPWHYRGKVQFPVAGSSSQPEIGFYASRSHQVIPAPECSVQPPVCDVIREILGRHIQKWQIEPYQEMGHCGLLRHLIVRIGFFTGEVMIILAINGDSLPGHQELFTELETAIAACHDPVLPPLRLASFYLNINKDRTNLILTPQIRLLAGQPWIEERILGLRYQISPLAFFQVNPRQTVHLYATVLEMSGLTGKETVLDLYCGTGSISLLLARQARKVIGIEIVEEAIADARANAALNGITNTQFYAGKAEILLPKLVQEGLDADAAVLDPPRKGCDPALLAALTELKIRRIVYVSCNPATLARDINILQTAGYVVQAVQPVDMFPWTGHVETVVLMSRV